MAASSSSVDTTAHGAKGPAALPHASLFNIRTVTAFVPTRLSTTPAAAEVLFAEAFTALTELKGLYELQGFNVQTIRIAMTSLPALMAAADSPTKAAWMKAFKSIPSSVRVSVGSASSIEELAILEDLVLNHNGSGPALIPSEDHAFRVAAAETMLRLGARNFDFCVNSNVQPCTPFFPAGYSHAEGPMSFALGLQFPDLVNHLLGEVLAGKVSLAELEHAAGAAAHPSGSVYAWLKAQLQPYMARVTETMQAWVSSKKEKAAGYSVAGVDTSLAPAPLPKEDASVAKVYENIAAIEEMQRAEVGAAGAAAAVEKQGQWSFGQSGTVAITAKLTSLLKALLPKELQVGYCGVMLCPLEDAVLADAAGKGRVHMETLLSCSAVCGIGYDTVPIPGNATVPQLVGLMNDISALAFRLNKPLSVRLFPVEGMDAGQMASFDNPYLCDTPIFKI